MLVSAPCRLHFGLFHVPVEGLTHWPDGMPIRKFGGLGMMVRDERVTVGVVPNDRFEAMGPLGERAVAFAKMLPGTAPTTVIASGPSEHTGMGVGTSLALTVGRALGWDVHDERLPRLLGRGNRSGIGIEGFRRGGFIVDDGKIGDELPTIRERISVPNDWHVVLIRLMEPGHWHGDRERAAFGRGRSPHAALDTTLRLRRMADEEIIPALKSADFDAFTRGLTQFNRTAGEPFAPDQGGPYASPAIESLVDHLIGMGVRGVGQSSWGPTVFAFARDSEEAIWITIRAHNKRNDILTTWETPADNAGVRVHEGHGTTPSPSE
jgi:beta-ribofuranosylaminobenzene 5'-phosphate synthase